MDIFEKAMATKAASRNFPNEGYCRVPTCGMHYERTGPNGGGRRGMCRTHYRFFRKAIKSGEIDSWHEIDKKWPEVKPFMGLTQYNFEAMQILESDWQNQVTKLVSQLGHGYWNLNPYRREGIPDLLIVTKDGRVLFRELKYSGEPSPQQKEVIDGLVDNGNDADVWKPQDWDNGRILRELQGHDEVSESLATP